MLEVRSRWSVASGSGDASKEDHVKLYMLLESGFAEFHYVVIWMFPNYLLQARGGRKAPGVLDRAPST